MPREINDDTIGNTSSGYNTYSRNLLSHIGSAQDGMPVLRIGGDSQ